MYKELEKAIQRFGTWKGLDVFEIGKSTLNQSIYAVHVGDFSGPQIWIDASIHAREYITSYLLVEMIKNLRDKEFLGGFYFIPLCNPDGVRIAMEGISWIEDEKLRRCLSIINDNPNCFSLWKANALGVDLNVNFDADWGGGSQNIFKLAPANFVGFYPNSEKENIILIDFVKKINPKACISYHSKGEVVYYGFNGLSSSQLIRDLTLAQEISKITGYEVVKTQNSTGGFTDWISRIIGIPALTIEVGADNLSHPIPLSELPKICEQNINVPLAVLDFIARLV